MANLNDLANRIDKVPTKIGMQVVELKRQIVIAIVTDLAYKTPVDTSQALSNWDVSTGQPITVKHGPYFAGFAGSTKGVSAIETIARAVQAAKQFKPNETAYIANNQPYIRKLNDGWSAQAPAGFAQRAVIIGRKTMQQFKLKV